MLTPEFKAAWLHDLTQGPIATNALLGGVNLTPQTPRILPDGAQFSFAAILQQNDNLSMRIEYDGEQRDGYGSHTGLVKMNWGF